MGKDDNHMDKLIAAAFEAAKSTSWSRLCLQDIADEAGLKVSDIAEHVSTKADILTIYGRRIDKQMLENIGEPDPSMSAKDRLFDVMMERFDLMNQDREALTAIIKSVDLEPLNVLENVLRLKKAVITMINGAGLQASGVRGKIRQKGVCFIYLVSLKTWLDDESPDLSATMVKLDKLLGRAEQFANTFGMAQEDHAVV